MNILMVTNTYLPHVGGVARSVAAFSRQYRQMGHQVMVVSPEFDGNGHAVDGVEVVRVPAIQNFNGSEFSMVLPVSGLLSKAVKNFKPNIVHSHHPFLIGSTALRIAAINRLPHVFTHHTMYEQYTHYVSGDSLRLQNFARELATHYANLCDLVFAPSESIADILKAREVSQPILVIPTGVELERFAKGDPLAFRAKHRIPKAAFVVGHLGRFAKEKNLAYLATAISLFLRQNASAYALIAGQGPAADTIQRIFSEAGVSDRVVILGVLEGDEFCSAYRSMDVFAFASRSETQGMVLIEAMAAKTPVLALDAPGVREVVKNGVNGRLLFNLTSDGFARELSCFSNLSKADRHIYRQNAFATAQQFSMQNSATKALAAYQQLIDRDVKNKRGHEDLWSGIVPLIQSEWDLVISYAESAGKAVFENSPRDMTE